MTDALFDKEERKEARKRAKEISKKDLLAEAIKKVIQGSTSAAYTGSF